MTVERLSRSEVVARQEGRIDINLHRALQALLIAAPVAYILGFLVAAYFRLTYPYPMWVMETPALQAVRRLLQGQPLYGPPTLEYVPSLYTPLYFYVSAALAMLLGPSLFTLRLVSLVASIGSAALVGHLVWRETRSRLATVVAAGLFICSSTQSQSTLDLARVDALSLCLLLAALDVARAADFASSRRGAVLWLDVASGILVGLAVLTKQTAVTLLLVLVVNATLTARLPRVAGFVLGAAVTLGAAAVFLGFQYVAWPVLYLIDLPRQHSLELQRLEAFWSHQLLPGFTLPLLALPVFLLGRWLTGDRAAVRFWILAGLGMLAMAWGASLNQWSGDNVMMPVLAILSAGFGLGLAEAMRRLENVGSRQAQVFGTYVLALGLLEFAFVHYNPRQTSPLRSDVQAGEEVVAAIHALPGSVYAPELPEFIYDAGKGDDAFGLSIGELQGIFGGKPRPEAGRWTTKYAQALDERRFDQVLLDPDGVLPFLSDATRDHGYVDTGPLIPSGHEFYRLASRYMPGAHVWVPRERVPHPGNNG